MKHIAKASILGLTLALTLALAACGTNASSSAGSASTESANASASSTAQAVDLFGKPWVTSILIGNLPAAQPELKDDMYAHYDYDFLAAHQDQDSSVKAEYAHEIPAALLQIIQDNSKTSHELEQLRLFFNQAADLETVVDAGVDELIPYLDRIETVNSIQEMNALLTADDFPFSPFIVAGVTLNDTRATNIVDVMPNLVLSDAQLDGGTYYQDSDDPQQQAALDAALENAVSMPILDFIGVGVVGIDDADAKQAASDQIKSFEKAHARYLDSTSSYMKADYGAMAQVARDSYFTLDELTTLAPNFPLKEVLEKLGKSNSETYVSTREWLEAFNSLWTDENLEAIKMVAQAKILAETRPFRDPTLSNAMLESVGLAPKDANTFAYEACSNLDTFAQVLAKTYATEVLGEQAKERLTKLSQDLIAEYKTLIESTPWMSDDSKQRILEKLDHMALNVLEPVGGYFDYSGLELKPSDQGGTLLSNYLALKQYRWDMESKMVGAPAIPASPWFTASPLINNAFYDPSSNSINIMPGYVTSLVYRDDMDDAELLACAGFTIAHEISHSFDYTGSQVDAYGQPNPVFADADVDAFVLKTTTLASYYKGIELAPDYFVDGQNVVGEAAADLCGMQANFELAKKMADFDYDKYFRSLSNMWAVTMTSAEAQQMLLDIHPMYHLRVNVNAQMFDPIYDIMGVTEGDGMYLAPEQRISLYGPSA